MGLRSFYYLVTFITLIFISVYSNFAQARFSLGVSTGAAYGRGGRVRPSLQMSVGGQNWALLGITSGVRTTTYYHSSYIGALLYMWKPGKILWGDVETGFGIGGHYTERGYREGSEFVSEMVRHGDGLGGLALKADWSILGPIFVSTEGFMGISRGAWILSISHSMFFTLGIKI